MLDQKAHGCMKSLFNTREWYWKWTSSIQQSAMTADSNVITFAYCTILLTNSIALSDIGCKLAWFQFQVAVSNPMPIPIYCWDVRQHQIRFDTASQNVHIYTVADCYLSSFSLFLRPIPRPPLVADNIPHSTPLILQQGFLVYIDLRGRHPNLRSGFLIYINLRRRHLNPPRPRFVAKNSSILFRPANLIETTLKTSSDLSPSSMPIRMRQWSCSATKRTRQDLQDSVDGRDRCWSTELMVHLLGISEPEC